MRIEDVVLLVGAKNAFVDTGEITARIAINMADMRNKKGGERVMMSVRVCKRWSIVCFLRSSAVLCPLVSACSILD